MGHKFKARDKTVKKMSLDGLTDKKLNSYESDAAGPREAGSLTRPGRADLKNSGRADMLPDSERSMENGKTGSGRKRRVGIRAESQNWIAAGSTGAAPLAKDTQPALTQPDQGRLESQITHITSDITSACQDNFMDRAGQTDYVTGDRVRGDGHTADRTERDCISAESASLAGRKEISRELESPFRDHHYAGECREKAGGHLNTKSRRRFSYVPQNSGTGADSIRHTQKQRFHDGDKEMEPCLPSGNENGKETEYMPADDSTDKGGSAAVESGFSAHPFRMGNMRRQPFREAGFVKAAAVGAVSGRKIKNVLDADVSGKQEQAYSAKQKDGKNFRKKQGQYFGREAQFSKDIQKKEQNKPEMPCDEKESHRQQNYFHNRRGSIVGMPSGNRDGKEQAEKQSGAVSAGNVEGVRNLQSHGFRKNWPDNQTFRNHVGHEYSKSASREFLNSDNHGPTRSDSREIAKESSSESAKSNSREPLKPDGRELSKPDSRTALDHSSREFSKQGKDAPHLTNGKQQGRIQSGGRKWKKASRLFFDDENNSMVRGRDMGIAKRAAVMAAAAACERPGGDGGQEQEDAAVHGMKQTAGYAALRTVRKSVRKRQPVSLRQRRQCMSDRGMRRESLKHGKPPEPGKKQPGQHGGEKARQEKKETEKKAWQKRMIKKSYQAQSSGGPASALPMAVPELSAQPFLFRKKQKAVKKIREHRGVLVAVAILVLLAVAVSAGMSSCCAMLQGASSSIIGTTYISGDDDIYAAEADYAALEDALDSQVNGMESAHPGFDEYRYQVDEISHNPYHLISCLTAAYGGFTYKQAKDALPVLFESQYRLTVEEIVEIHTGTELDADTGEEVEVECEWRVLCIRLENRGIDGAAADFLTAEQAGRYAAYNATKGNRDDLFDAESVPSGGAADNAQPDSGIPDEALSDVQFANMIREAEKYIGYPYVWGGSSPQTSFDCSGFVSWVINNCGNGWNVGRQTAEGLRGCCSYVPPADAKPGDLIFFQGTYNTPGASHVGIYVGNNRMVHCGNPVQYANINTAYWQQHFLSFGRLS